ncbi:hypothetical protein J2Z44_002319 [Clostridium punense]|uniref:Transposase IS116/IS110/IS902 C-terminal domain-containing protein n=1 Tax=Clostridium punense TaxID=1054297 RepID=A0ABS4K3Y3_9CLOT|nr:hypothetical protein M918_13305 [Clostridium sp. BL8]MBP2022498.1 hypothetical protein [Clostridium punense]
MAWAEKVYSKLINVDNEATTIGVPVYVLVVKINTTLTLINTLEIEINNLLTEIKSLIVSDNFSEQIKRNIDLLDSILGVGLLIAITLIAKIGDINSFIKPKHLVAFFGINKLN